MNVGDIKFLEMFKERQRVIEHVGYIPWFGMVMECLKATEERAIILLSNVFE